MAEREINRHEFNAYKTSVDHRLGRLEKDMDAAMGDIKKLPSREEIKKDLDNQTVILTHSISNLQSAIKTDKEREKEAADRRDKKAVAFRWKVGVIVAIGGPIFILALNIIAKKMGWL